MFDIGFSELMLIALVALVVIGPERLPRVARTMGHLFGRLQRYVNEVKADINREMELEELRKFKSEFEQAAQSMETHLKEEMHHAEASVNELAAQASLRPEIEKTEAELAALSHEAAGDPHAAAAEPLSVPAAPIAVPGEPAPAPAETGKADKMRADP